MNDPIVTYVPSSSTDGGSFNAGNINLGYSASGLIQIVVDASDPSGVVSTNVTRDPGYPITKDPVRSTPSHFVGSWDSRTQPDGTRNLRIDRGEYNRA